MTRRSILAAIFLSSVSCLGYEIVLTRIFTVSLWHHFAFMIISIAMLGTGASGTALSRFPALRNTGNTGLYCLCLGVCLSAGYLLANQVSFDPARLAWDKTQLLTVGLYYLTLSPPFFFSGLLVATALASSSQDAGLLYGADLLGAGAGSLGVLLILRAASPERAVFILSCIPLAAAVLAGGRRLKVLAVALVFINLWIILAGPSFSRVRMSPYKGLSLALQFPGSQHLSTFLSPFSQIDSFNSPAARFAPGLSLKYLDDLPRQIGLAVDGGDLNAITEGNDTKRLSFLRHLPSAVPYEMAKKDDVLVMDPRGGLEVLVARVEGAQRVFKVESNRLFVRVVGNTYAEFSGEIYRDHIWVGLGRSWLMSHGGEFDIIDVPLFSSMPTGSFGIVEDYRFTVEAFMEYLQHLKHEGILSINLAIIPPPRTELRLLATAAEALRSLGIRNPSDHVAAVRSLETVCILVKKAPFAQREITALKGFSSDRQFDLVQYPGIREEESNLFVRTQSNEYFRAFQSVLDERKRREFSDGYLFDILPVRDDNPFFQYHLKLGNLAETYKAVGGKWEFFIEEGYILPVVFIQVLLIGLLLVAFSGVRKKTGKGKDTFLLLLYFAFLGVGFMFVEVPLIQRMILPLENPPYAVAAVLTSLLISSGAGSLAAQRKDFLRRPGILLAVATVSVAYGTLLPILSRTMVEFPLALRLFFVLPLLFPVGFVMGIPFPSGMRVLGELEPGLIPRAWAINGCLSVLAPVLAVMLATVLGFRLVLLLGAVSYGMGFICLTASLRPPRSSEQRRQVSAAQP